MPPGLPTRSSARWINFLCRCWQEEDPTYADEQWWEADAHLARARCFSHEVISELQQKRPLRPQSQDHQPFTMKELTKALNKLKKKRAPGPDHNANELFLPLDVDNLDILLLHYNEIRSTGEVPTNWKEAIVVSIYKGKGTDTDPANYRPISFNTIYKIFASMLQARLAQEHDSHLRDTQVGFRARKGTRHPLFIMRGAMEWSEATGQPMHHMFLDWKQAFA